MPEAFNTPKYAIDFLRRRGVFDKMLTKEAGYWRTFVGINRGADDEHEAAAILYLADHDYPCALRGVRYTPTRPKR